MEKCREDGGCEKVPVEDYFVYLLNAQSGSDLSFHNLD